MLPNSIRFPAVLAAVLLAAAGFRLFAVYSEYSRTRSHRVDCHQETGRGAEDGERLIHGVDVLYGVNAPLAAVADAIGCHDAGLPWHLLFPGAVFLGCSLLVFGLGRLAGSALCGALSLLLFSAIVDVESGFASNRWFYNVTVLLVAYVMVWRARRPSPAKSLLLGTAIGLSVLVLSPLFLLPPVILLHEWVSGGRPAPAGRRLGDAAALCLPMLVMLSPWVLMHWREFHRFVLFEGPRADNNIITGVLGVLNTVGDLHPENTRAWAGIGPEQSLMAWAAKTILRHPWRYVTGVAARAWWCASAHPWLFLMGGLSLSLKPRRPEAVPLGIMAAYGIGIHCLMSVESRYIFPFLPVAAVLAATLVLRLPGLSADPLSDRASAIPAAAVFIPLAALTTWVSWLMLVHPGRWNSPANLDRQIAGWPACDWLWTKRGLRHLDSGNPSQAAADLERAFLLEPDSLKGLQLAWAHLASGAPLERFERLLAPPSDDLACERLVLKAFFHLNGNRLDLARGDFSRADLLNKASFRLNPEIAGLGAMGIDPAAKRFDELIAARLSYWTPEQRRTLIRRLETIADSRSGFFLDRSRVARIASTAMRH